MSAAKIIERVAYNAEGDTIGTVLGPESSPIARKADLTFCIPSFSADTYREAKCSATEETPRMQSDLQN